MFDDRSSRQSITASASRSAGAPVSSAPQSPSANRSARAPRAGEALAPAPRDGPQSILTAKAPLARIQRSVEEFALRQTIRDGGSSDSEVNDEAAQPARLPSKTLVTRATPEANSRMAPERVRRHSVGARVKGRNRQSSQKPYSASPPRAQQCRRRSPPILRAEIAVNQLPTTFAPRSRQSRLRTGHRVGGQMRRLAPAIMPRTCARSRALDLRRVIVDRRVRSAARPAARAPRRGGTRAPECRPRIRDGPGRTT